LRTYQPALACFLKPLLRILGGKIEGRFSAPWHGQTVQNRPRGRPKIGSGRREPVCAFRRPEQPTVPGRASAASRAGCLACG